MISGDHYQADELAAVIRGEAKTSIRSILIPLIAGRYARINGRDVADSGLLIDLIAGSLVAEADKIEQSSLSDLWQSELTTPGEYEVPLELSPGAKKFYESSYMGSSAWSRGWARTASVHSRTKAALAILTGSGPPLAVISGLSFVFDPVTRVLSYPGDKLVDGISSEPVTLP